MLNPRLAKKKKKRERSFEQVGCAGVASTLVSSKFVNYHATKYLSAYLKYWQ